MTASLNCILCWTGSQCKDFSSGVALVYFDCWSTTRAKEFWVLCRIAIERFGDPGTVYVTVVKLQYYNATHKSLCNVLSQQMLYVPEGPDLIIARLNVRHEVNWLSSMTPRDLSWLTVRSTTSVTLTDCVSSIFQPKRIRWPTNMSRQTPPYVYLLFRSATIWINLPMLSLLVASFKLINRLAADKTILKRRQWCLFNYDVLEESDLILNLLTDVTKLFANYNASLVRLLNEQTSLYYGVWKFEHVQLFCESTWNVTSQRQNIEAQESLATQTDRRKQEWIYITVHWWKGSLPAEVRQSKGPLLSVHVSAFPTLCGPSYVHC